MAQSPDWKQLLETGMQFTEMRRSQAKRIAQDLASRGQIARDQLSGTVDELVEMSRRRSENLRKIVQKEVQRQVGALGLATKEDLARVERRLSANAAKRAPAKKTAKKAPATRAAKATKATKATPAAKTAKASGNGHAQ
jgi:polyhydroxyalkanoate synthesis regulator phasin